MQPRSMRLHQTSKSIIYQMERNEGNGYLAFIYSTRAQPLLRWPHKLILRRRVRLLNAFFLSCLSEYCYKSDVAEN